MTTERVDISLLEVRSSTCCRSQLRIAFRFSQTSQKSHGKSYDSSRFVPALCLFILKSFEVNTVSALSWQSHQETQPDNSVAVSQHPLNLHRSFLSVFRGFLGNKANICTHSSAIVYHRCAVLLHFDWEYLPAVKVKICFGLVWFGFGLVWFVQVSGQSGNPSPSGL